MLTLSGSALETSLAVPALFRLTTVPDLPAPLRAQRAFLMRGHGDVPEGFAHYLVFDGHPIPANGAAFTRLDEKFAYLSDDDIVHVAPHGHVRTLFRSASNHNSILLTEQCNNYCLMCSQPPKRKDDRWIVDEVRQLVPMMPRTTKSLGITGGEPTLFGDDFLDIIRLCKNWLPATALHVLSNGRSFADAGFARNYAAVDHPALTVGIPVYSDDPSRHDYVVQEKGAFDETIRGILNLKRFGQRVEIRVVVHKQTFERLPELAEFIARNLVFVDHVALMGLEMMGFTRANLDALWIDPIEYRDELSAAVAILRAYRIPVSVYNHQLCLINPDVGIAYVKSISDWKNEYAPECDGCARGDECGGFFSSGVKHGYSPSIKPFPNRHPAVD